MLPTAMVGIRHPEATTPLNSALTNLAVSDLHVNTEDLGGYRRQVDLGLTPFQGRIFKVGNRAIGQDHFVYLLWYKSLFRLAVTFPGLCLGFLGLESPWEMERPKVTLVFQAPGFLLHFLDAWCLFFYDHRTPFELNPQLLVFPQESLAQNLGGQ